MSREVDVEPETVAPVLDVSNVPVLDGKTINVFTSPKGKKLNYVVRPNVSSKNFQQTIEIRQGLDIESIKNDLMNVKGQTKDQAKYNIQAQSITTYLL